MSAAGICWRQGLQRPSSSTITVFSRLTSSISPGVAGGGGGIDICNSKSCSPLRLFSSPGYRRPRMPKNASPLLYNNVGAFHHHHNCRSFSTTAGKDPTATPKIAMHRRGDFPYGSREYLLLLQYPKHAQPQDENNDDDNDDDIPNKPIKIASLRAHRNIIFGAKLFGETADKRKLVEVCLPLLDAALEDAGRGGSQPQAVATLHGLCDWVTQCLENNEYHPPEHYQQPDQQQKEEKVEEKEEESTATEIEIETNEIEIETNETEIETNEMEIETNENDGENESTKNRIYKSEVLEKLKKEETMVAFHAVRAIATGIPREGHSIVGQGTFRDGEEGWEKLANEFIKLEMAQEVELYQARDGAVVVIEHLADTKPDYLKSAGGAMARLFFV